MDSKKDKQELLWELIRKNSNNKTRAAKALGMSRQLFNYYVNQITKLSDELIRKINILLGKQENPATCFLKRALRAAKTHPMLLRAEKETQLPIRKVVEEILEEI